MAAAAFDGEHLKYVPHSLADLQPAGTWAAHSARSQGRGIGIEGISWSPHPGSGWRKAPQVPSRGDKSGSWRSLSPAYALRTASMYSGVSMGRSPPARGRDAPDMVISVQGDISSRAQGIRRPAAFKRRHSTRARLPPRRNLRHHYVFRPYP